MYFDFSGKRDIPVNWPDENVIYPGQIFCSRSGLDYVSLFCENTHILSQNLHYLSTLSFWKDIVSKGIIHFVRAYELSDPISIR